MATYVPCPGCFGRGWHLIPDGEPPLRCSRCAGEGTVPDWVADDIRAEARAFIEQAVLRHGHKYGITLADLG